MFIKGFACGPLDTFAYLVSDGQPREDGFAAAAVIDCSYGSSSLILAEAQRCGFKIEKILNTHGHFDHTADNYPLQQATGAAIFIHPSDEWRLKEPYKEAFPIPFPIIPTQASAYLHDGDTITVGSLKFEVLHTPGHTLGGVCFYEPTRHVLFSGDTLFKDSVGRWDFLDGNLAQLVQSLTRLLVLPSNTIVYPGHGSSTTIGREQQCNPLVRQLVRTFY